MNGDYSTDEEWIEDDAPDGDDLLECPSCGQSVHEETQQCPSCGDWIIPAYPGERSKRFATALIAAIVLLAIVLVYLL